MTLKVLLVEEQGGGNEISIRPNLVSQGCDVTLVHDPYLVAATAQTEWPDLIVLSTATGALDLGDVCRLLDNLRVECPRLIVCSREGHDHLPASAHLSVPFTPRQLAYRLKKATNAGAERLVRAGDITVDRSHNRVKHHDRVLTLTPKESRLLQLLMLHAGEILDRSRIMKEVWETDYVDDTRTIEVHISWLRAKLEDDPHRPRHILTVRGTGYCFQLPADRAAAPNRQANSGRPVSRPSGHRS